MKQNLRLGATLLGAYLAFLLATLPAPLVLGKLQARLAPLALHDVSGTLWCGRAASLNYAMLHAAHLDWSVHPVALLLGRLETGWSLDDAALRGKGTLGRTLGGSVYLSDLDAQADLQALQASGLLRIMLPISGRAEFALHKLRYADGKLAAADGTIDVKGVALQALSLPLGDFHLDLATQQAGVKATLSDRGGALHAQGVAMITPDGAYQFSGNFAARDPNQSALQQYLRMLGKVGADGRVSVNYTGHL